MADAADLLIQPSLAQDASQVALARLAERLTTLDLSPVVVLDVDRAPAEALPHLADRFHILHTVAWRRAVDDRERRGLIKSAIRRHRLKGTLAGFRQAAKDAGAELVRAITPPAKVFSAPALTLAERNAFVARYPQLRIYRHRVAGQRQGAVLAGAALGHAYPAISDAVLRLLPRVYLYRDGKETELTAIEREVRTETRTAETVTEVRQPGQAAGVAFCDGYPRHLARSDARRRIYRLKLTQTYQESAESVRRTMAQPGLMPLDVRYDQVAMPGTARGLFAGRHLLGQLCVSTARDRLYQRLYLFDADIAVGRRQAALHLNQGRLSMPAYHAELAVRVTGRAQPKAVWRFAHGHLVAQPQSDLSDCLEAMRDTARAADRIAIDTLIRRPAGAGEHLAAGGIVAGDWIVN